MDSVHPNTRRRVATLLTSVVALTGATALALPAASASTAVNTAASLASQASSCTDGDELQVTGPIIDTTVSVSAMCNLTLDLNGQPTALAAIAIDPGKTLTIHDSGSGGVLVLTAGSLTAGIQTTGATLVVQSGTISAFGGAHGAGIGGSSLQGGGTVIINGGTVSATGDLGGAGIGGGDGGVADGGTITINGGTVTAFGGESGAGIGGGNAGDSGTITISNGAVKSTGGAFASGIGGGSAGGGGTISVSGGVVKAYGGKAGAGIGTGVGGLSAVAGTITFSGGVTTATGANLAAGIGGGKVASGGTVSVQAGATVTASGGFTAVGGGDVEFPDDPTVFGTLTVAGTLRLPNGQLVIPATAVPSDQVTVASTGVITGAPGTPTVGADIVGDGQINNGGSITLATPSVIGADVTTKTHHYAVTFDPQGGSPTPSEVRVFAKSFDDGARTFPAAPTKPGYLFAGWNTAADGPGSTVTGSSTLSGSSDGSPLIVPLFAKWSADIIAGLAPTITGTPEEGETLTAHTGSVTPVATTTFTYQWKAGGSAIQGATDPTFLLRKQEAGRRITVAITAHSVGQPAQTMASAQTRIVASDNARLVLSKTAIGKGQAFRVTATGLKPNQRVRIWLGGKQAYSGHADSFGVVDRSVKFTSSIKPGNRRVRVSGYDTHDKRTYTIFTNVRYRI